MPRDGQVADDIAMQDFWGNDFVSNGELFRNARSDAAPPKSARESWTGAD